MRLISSMALALCLCTGPMGCAEATPETACENVAIVCKGNTNEQKAKTACESAASNAQQKTLDCVEAAASCDAALACTTTTGD